MELFFIENGRNMKHEPYKIIIEQCNSPNLNVLGEIFELLINKEKQNENTKDKGD